MGRGDEGCIEHFELLESEELGLGEEGAGLGHAAVAVDNLQVAGKVLHAVQ